GLRPTPPYGPRGRGTQQLPPAGDAGRPRGRADPRELPDSRSQGADRQAESGLDHRRPRRDRGRGAAGMRAFVGLGSNLGEREALIRQALDELTALPDTTLIRVSSLYDTAPVGEIEQPPFLNAVGMLDTELTARQLLWNLQRIEARL